MKTEWLWDKTGYIMKIYTQEDLRGLLSKHIKAEYGKQATAAKCWGLSPAMVNLCLNGSRKIPDFIAEEMGFKHESVYVKVKK